MDENEENEMEPWEEINCADCGVSFDPTYDDGICPYCGYDNWGHDYEEEDYDE